MLSGLQSTWMVPRSGRVVAEFQESGVAAKTPVALPVAGVAAGFFFHPQLNVELAYRRMFGTLSGESYERGIWAFSSHFLALSLAYSPVPFFFVSGGFLGIATEMGTSGFSAPAHGANHTLGFLFQAGVRLAFFRWLEFVPRIEVAPAQFSFGLGNAPVLWHVFSIEYINARFHF